jgi:hypothetical protein
MPKNRTPSRRIHLILSWGVFCKMLKKSLLRKVPTLISGVGTLHNYLIYNSLQNTPEMAGQTGHDGRA